MKHTPGPWRVWALRGGSDGIFGRDGIVLARTMHKEVDEQAANARLIAAAPDLLEACENIYANMADRDELYDDENGEEWAEVRLIREAIEKAKGINQPEDNELTGLQDRKSWKTERRAPIHGNN